MIERPGTRLPAGLLHRSGLCLSIRIAVSLALCVMIAGFRSPLCVGMRVEGPVGEVNSFQRIRERCALEPVRREPTIPVPGANVVAHLRLGQLERHYALGTDRILGLLVR